MYMQLFLAWHITACVFACLITDFNKTRSEVCLCNSGLLVQNSIALVCNTCISTVNENNDMRFSALKSIYMAFKMR